MYFGMPFSCSFGNPEDIILFDQPPLDLNAGARVRAKTIVGYEQYGRLIIDGVGMGTPQYMGSDDYTEFRGLYNTDITNHPAQVMPQGDWASPIIDTTAMSVFFQVDRGNQFNLFWFAAPEIFSSEDSGQLTSWDFNNSDGICTVIRFANCSANQLRPSWGELTLDLTTVAGVHTLELYKGEFLMASGSRTGDGAITLTASNESAIEGTVTLTYTADFTDGKVSVRFPVSYKIHYKTTPFTAPDFPRTAEATVLDDGLSGNAETPFSYITSALTQPTYYVVVHQVDDCGNEGTGIQGGGVIININVPPNPPGTPVYTSGNNTNTVITYAASSTVGATYNIYDSLATGIMDMQTPTQTTALVAPTLTAISAFTGIRYLVVRALSGGIEEGNNNTLQIEYLAGVVVKPRPPIPGVGFSISTTTTTATIPFTVDLSNANSTPTAVELNLNSKSDFTGTDYTATVLISTLTLIGSTYTGSATATGITAGKYWYRLRSYNATTSTYSSYSDVFGPIQVENVVPPDPVGITALEGA